MAGERWRAKTLLSTREAGDAVGWSVEFIRARIESGELPATAWVSGARVIYKIRPRDLEAFIARMSAEPLDARLDDIGARRPAASAATRRESS